MNSKPNQSRSFSQADADLLSRLSDLAKTIEPESIFQAELETKLLQAHRANSPTNRSKGANRMTVKFRGFDRRTSLVAGSCVALSIALMIPAFRSRQVTEWLSAMLNSTVASKVNAQTIASAQAAGQIIFRADATEYNEKTQKVRGIGNASFVYPEAQIQAKAEELQFVSTSDKISLLGNVQISQKGETLRGKQAICSLEQKQCTVTQK
ncbi:OstA family protein [Leptolyngbya sp. NIES-3755]|nr:OstA family protein [Leptolyngbya sp. NIES-3755]